MNVPLFTSNRQHEELMDELMKATEEVIRSGKFILGPWVAKFEEKVAEYLGVKYAVGVGNGTDAISIALSAIDIKPGDEVITTPFTFIATAETIAMLGARPVFVDIDPDTFNINPELIEESLYYKHVKTYKILFGKRYKIFLFDDLKRDPKNFARELFSEFGIEWDSKINYNIQILPAARARSFYLARLSKKLAGILRSLGYLQVLGFLKNNPLVNRLLFVPYEKKPEMPEDLKYYLWNNYFREDVEKLSELLKMNLIDKRRIV